MYGNRSFKAAILGDGPYLKKCKKLASCLDLDENVQFLGYKTDVAAYLNQSKVFMMTSDYEGLPMAMIEALSCGLPCIMPNISNINTVAIHAHNALLYSVGDNNQCAEYLNNLLTDHGLYNKLSMNALRIKSEKSVEYSIDNVSSKWSSCLSLLTRT